MGRWRTTTMRAREENFVFVPCGIHPWVERRKDSLLSARAGPPHLPICRKYMASLGATLDALQDSSARLRSSLLSIREASDVHAVRCSAVESRLDRAWSSLSKVREEGEALRSEAKLLQDIESVRKLLDGGALRRCVIQLEDVSRRAFAQQQKARSSSRSRSQEAVTEMVSTVARALEDEWRAWTLAGGDALFQGARALALAPPGPSPAGGGLPSAAAADGLERERVALEEANTHLMDAERIDAIAVVAGVKAHASAEPLVATCHALFREHCASRLASELRTAVRLVDSAENSTVLEAVAEASSTASKAVRSIASVFGLLPPPPAAQSKAVDGSPPSSPSPAVREDGAAAEEPPTPGIRRGAAEAAAIVAEAAEAKELAGFTDGLLAMLRALPPPADKGRPAKLKALGGEASETLRRVHEASPQLISAAHSTRGRRALSVLAEAGERLASAASAQARSERAR